MVVLGVDAGGTKTVCQLADATGTVLAEMRGAGAHLQSVGEPGVEAVLRDLINRALDKCGRPQIAAMCLGMAGVDQPVEADIVRRIMERIGQHSRALVVNDALIALEAGAPAAPGVVVIAGTGSMAYGRDAHGHAARAGGWGFVLADEGSGYWLGRQALRAAVRAVDHRGPRTILTDRVFAHYGVSRSADLAREVYAGGVKPAAIASLAADVDSAAGDGDAVALKIIDAAATELAWAARAVARRLHLEQGPIILSGGVFQLARTLDGRVRRALEADLPSAPVRVLDVEPAYGAVRFALALSRGPVTVPQYGADA